MCVALAALEAVVHVSGVRGERTIPFAEFHRLPGDRPELDTTLAHDEIVTAVELPPEGYAANYTYLKLRDRLSYAFALVSVAAGLTVEGETVKCARIALGGVAHKPWRVPQAEALLEGKQAGPEAFEPVATRLLQGAQGFGENGFKIDLAHRAIIRALSQAAAGTPQPVADKQIV
jgi:xanthine dehydrogenase YagS FAD-binding subunit